MRHLLLTVYRQLALECLTAACMCVQVCKGCRLMRSCKEYCHTAAWPQHREHCRDYQALQNDAE